MSFSRSISSARTFASLVRGDQHLALREDHRVGAGEVVGELFEARRHDAK